MLHKLYSAVIPLFLRTAAGQCRNKIKSCWWNLQYQISPIKCWCIRQRVSTAKAHRKRRARHRALLESGKVINVVFEVTGIPKWKGDSLLRLMMKHPRFRPLVWYVPYIGREGSEGVQRDLAQCNEHFSAMGAKMVCYASMADFPSDETPDIIFPNEPYDVFIFSQHHNNKLLDYLLCFIPYAYTSSASSATWNHIITNAALFNFTENNVSYRKVKSYLTNHGINAVNSGHPMADSFLFPMGERCKAWRDCGSSKRKVIWAPHWTIQAETNGWIYYGTFLSTAEAIMELVQQYKDQIQFAFKPHPNLYDTLCKHPNWGKERTDAFYAKWREMPNTQFEDGAYVDLFMQSDAMIHDCGSFIQEYLFADKPCMYLREPENKQEYSAMAADCLNAYQIGITREEIEAFLQMVLRGEDSKAEERRELRQKYLIPPHGQSAAQNIIDCLLTQEHHS